MGSHRRGAARAQLIKQPLCGKRIEEPKLDATKVIPVEDDKGYTRTGASRDRMMWTEPSVL